MRIVVTVEGGLVQGTLADEDAEVLVVDYDADGFDDEALVEVPQSDGTTRQANVYRDDPYVAPVAVATLYALRRPQVLLIPDPEGENPPPYGIAPGTYTMPGLVALLRSHKATPGAVQFIADMLEE